MASGGSVVFVRKKHSYKKGFLITVAALLFLWEAWIYAGPFLPRSFGVNYFAHEQFNTTKHLLELAVVVASSQAVTNQKFEQAFNSTKLLSERLSLIENAASTTLVTKSQFSELANSTHLLLQRLQSLEDQFRNTVTILQFKEVLNATNNLLQRLDGIEKRYGDLVTAPQLGEVRDGVNHLLERLKVAESIGGSLQEKLEEQKTRLFSTAQKVDQLSTYREFNVRRSQEVAFLPLNDLERFEANAEKHGIHGFISGIWGRGEIMGPPEVLYFPSNMSHDRLLCIKGNSTSNGTHNFYAFAFRESLPPGSVLEPGITLITNSWFDFENPWHSMFNLAQFVYWNMNNACKGAHRLLPFHWGEVRGSIGSWISNILLSNHLPSRPDSHILSGSPVCFEQAVVSRIGIGGVPYWILRDLFREVRCQARKMCNVPFSRTGPSTNRFLHVTLMVRERARGFTNISAWENVVKKSCDKIEGCTWSSVHIANLSFCEQVAEMSRTDILISAHGAQLTNTIFLNPGSRVMEMFPRGWLELAGSGQYIYKNLAQWVGVQHEGYWRDAHTPECPKPNDPTECFSFYKDQKLGINATHIEEWVDQVIHDFNQKQANLTSDSAVTDDINSKFSVWDSPNCKCRVNSS